jgi:hypothetical protein
MTEHTKVLQEAAILATDQLYRTKTHDVSLGNLQTQLPE